MNHKALVIAALAVATAGFGPALADVAPVTMQPIANPPERRMKSHGHMAKHHKKAPGEPAPETASR